MDPGIEIRRGTPADSRASHQLLFDTIIEYEAKHGTPLEGTEEEWWAGNEPFYDYLAGDAAEWWVAEDRASGEMIGMARSIETDGVFELTEFFVRPGHQARGLGRELMARAFPLGRGTIRTIIATRDVRALARYYAAGVSIRFPILGLAGAPRATEPEPGLTASLVDGDADVAAIRGIERSILGFDRSAAALRTMLDNRETYLYRRGGTVVGFSFLSTTDAGPIGVRDAADMAGILLHVEDRAHALGMAELSFEVPGPNALATRHLLARGFKIDPFFAYLLSDREFGQFERWIGLSPPLFL